MWKYATAKGVNATPTVFINGVHLDAVPFSVADWMTLLNQIYDSQWHAPSSKPAQTANDACPIVEGSMSFWCQDSSSCIAGFPVDYTCDGGQVCCEHYCMEGENGCLQEEIVQPEPVNDACPLVEGSASFWCQDTSNCIAGFPVDYTCDGGQVCCEHYCMEGENGCFKEEEEPVNDACPIVEGSMSFWCQDSSSCIAGFPVDYTCDGGQVCCEHYCMEGENGCLESFLQ